MIQRFEDEYPETRLQTSDTASNRSSVASLPSSSPPISTVPTLDNSVTDMTAQDSDEEEGRLTVRSRHNSDVSLASRHMSQEEGRLHRFGHRVRTGLLNPSRPTSAHGDNENPSPAFLSGTMDDHGLPEHLLSLRMYFSNYSGDEMRQTSSGISNAMIPRRFPCSRKVKLRRSRTRTRIFSGRERCMSGEVQMRTILLLRTRLLLVYIILLARCFSLTGHGTHSSLSWRISTLRFHSIALPYF
jgi:hypothetical protein